MPSQRKQVTVFQRRGVEREREITKGHIEVVALFIILIVVWFHASIHMTKRIEMYTLSILYLCQVYLNRAIHFVIEK